VHHYYGTKEALFAAAMRIPVVPSEVLTAALSGLEADAPGFGAHLVRTALTLWESDGLKDTFLGLLRSAVTSEEASVMLREFISDSILSTVARLTGLDKQRSAAEAEYRAAMVATQMLGLALTRLVLGLPAVTGASVEELAATVGPSVERYLRGDIDLPARLAGRKRPSRSGGAA
jgi:AcrR family transcriptional regulator